MLYTKEQVIKGLTQYIDNEVIARLPTAGKWLAGTVLGLSLKSTQELINYAQDNEVVELLGIFNKDGLIDVDKIVGVAKKNATKYGNIVVTYPILGQLTFTPDDIDLLKEYIAQ